MKLPNLALALFAVCSPLLMHATKSTNILASEIQGITLEEIAELTHELLVPFKDGFQLEDLITVSSILDSHFNKNANMSTIDKRHALESVLDQIVNQKHFLPAHKEFLKHFVPALAFVIFPGSADDDLKLPENSSSSEESIIKVTDAFLKKLDGKLKWNDLPSSLILLRQVAISYPTLDSKEKAFLAKRVLGEIIDKTDTPYLPDAIFDEVFKRIGYPLIDYLVTKA